MSRFETYFRNHTRANRFPWCIYHKPLYKKLFQFLESHSLQGKKLLVIGPGDFQEVETLIQMGFRISILDIDPRVVYQIQQRYPNNICDVYIVNSSFSNYPAQGSFDLIYAKEVIEHFEQPREFLRHVFNILKSDGMVWLSTPNYGFFLLPLLEKTILEFIARISGFSRKTIHPTKYSQVQLEDDLFKTHFTDIVAEETPWRLALVATAHKNSL